MAGVRYRVLVGLSYPPDRRAESGDIVDDLPGKSIRWLLDSGLIESMSKDGHVPVASEADDSDGES